ncbi:MAG: hypothetical protein KBE04_10045 [Phycisphaerae bacterium]|nr:hypothetical protein [Phycisphaerae bacterium]
MIDWVAPILASFTQPESIGTTPQSMLWMLPLTAGIAVVYKATKVHRVVPRPFFKEAAILFGSIVAFMAVAALILSAVAWFVNEGIAS